MVELSGDGTYWNINTAGIFKTSYGKNAKEVYNRHTTDKPTAESVGALQDSELSGTTESSRMNAPTSERKDNNSAVEKQEKRKKESCCNRLKRRATPFKPQRLSLTEVSPYIEHSCKCFSF